MPTNEQPGVFVEEIPSGARPIGGVETSVAAFIGFFPDGPLRVPVSVASFAEFSREFGGLHARSEASYAVRQFFMNGGRRAVIVRAAESLARALSVLERGDFNLLCIPDMARLGASEFALLVRSATRVCRDRGAFLLVDPNVADDTAQAISHLDMTVGDENNAVYFPRLQVNDPLAEGVSRLVAPSGTMAGVYARTDAARGVWKAPAGLETTLIGAKLSGAGLAADELDQLNQRSINALRDMPGAGTVAWGARTGTNTGGDYKYIPVRRFALFIEASLNQGLQWVVFEPNAEPLWAEIRQSVDNFMLGLFRDGALRGTKAHDAYFVRCDHTTMTQTDIDSGIVNVEVGFAPLKPAEFIVLRHQFRAAAEN